MNTQSTPPEAPHGPENPGRPEGTGPRTFFDWIRAQGVSRGQDRWIGGVCSGLAHRFGIDPLIVRGLFVVLAVFAGLGVLAYGVAWALLPEADGRIHAEEAGAGRWSSGMTGAVITTIIGLPGLGHGFWGWSGLPGFFWAVFWVVAIGLIVWAGVHYSTGKGRTRQPGGGASPVRPDPVDSATAPFAPQGATSATGYATEGTGAPGATGWASSDPFSPPPPVPPLPAPGRPVPRAPRPPKPPRPVRRGPGSAAVAISAGAALLAGGTFKALDAAGAVPLGDAADAVAWAAGALVLGLGILVSGLRGRTSGFLGFLAVVSLAIGALLGVVPHPDHLSFQSRDWTPAGVAEAQRGFDLATSRGTVDLRALGASAPLGSPITVPVNVTASNVTLLLPDNIPVQVRSELTLTGFHQDGTDSGALTRTATEDLNAGKPGQPLVIRLRGTLSNIVIQEGPSR